MRDIRPRSTMITQKTIFRFLVLLSLFFYGCKPPHTDPVREDKPPTFGSDHLGFVLWLSEDASRAVVLRFDTDTNEDGEITADIGEHGELLGDKPTTMLVDTRTNAETRFTEFIATDARRSSALFLKDDHVVLLNGRSGKTRVLPDADLKPDSQNPCLPPRAAAISPDGNLVSWIKQGDSGIGTINLSTGKRVDHAFQDSSIWRIEQTNAVAIVHLATDTDGDGQTSWPTSSGTCSCWWCPRFARSIGRYVQSGDRPTKFSISETGDRMNIELDGPPIGFSSRKQLKLDKSCREIGKHGGEHVLLECKSGTLVADTKNATTKEVSRFAKIIDYNYVPNGSRYPVMNKGQMGAINLRSPESIESGPPTDLLSQNLHPSGWWVGREKDQLVAWNVEDGRTKRIDLPGVTWIDGLVVRVRDGERPQSHYLLNPETGKTRRMKHDPALVARNGCAVAERVTKRISRGPYELFCP